MKQKKKKERKEKISKYKFWFLRDIYFTSRTQSSKTVSFEKFSTVLFQLRKQ